METLTGIVKRETAKAIYFVPQHDSLGVVGPAWWPKSQIEVYERALGPLDQILVPEWLLAARQREEDMAIAAA